MKLNFTLNKIIIDRLPFEGTEPFVSLTERQLRQESDGRGIIIVESPKVIRTALESGFKPISLLTEEKHITGDAAEIIALCESVRPGIPIYTGPREILQSITGYTLTRGVLCAMERGEAPDVEEILKGADRICIIHDVNNTTNIGSIFRSAAALGIDAVLISGETCDPFNRRSIRVSMGTVFRVPWASCPDPLSAAGKAGFTTLGMALTEDAVTLDSIKPGENEKIAIVLGTEGDGLPASVLSRLDKRVIIPMHYGVDSLNVGVAAGIAFWELRSRGAEPVN